jgi:hypothetical protein
MGGICIATYWQKGMKMKSARKAANVTTATTPCCTSIYTTENNRSVNMH